MKYFVEWSRPTSPENPDERFVCIDEKDVLVRRLQAALRHSGPILIHDLRVMKTAEEVLAAH